MNVAINESAVYGSSGMNDQIRRVNRNAERLYNELCKRKIHRR